MIRQGWHAIKQRNNVQLHFGLSDKIQVIIYPFAFFHFFFFLAFWNGEIRWKTTSCLVAV